MYPFVVDVKYYDDFSPYSFQPRELHLLVYAETFTEAIHKIEDRYVDNIETICARSVADEGLLFEVPAAIADALVAGEGNYEEGLRKLNVAKEV